jgi:hypothetical protein
MAWVLLLTSNTWSSVAGVAPGRVPRANWIFSPSALIIWANPSSSIAMDENKRFNTSSRVKAMVGVILGRLGFDMVMPPHIQIQAECSVKAQSTRQMDSIPLSGDSYDS